VDEEAGIRRAEFTGHTTEYFIDGVPVKKGEYEQFVSQLLGSQHDFAHPSSPLVMARRKEINDELGEEAAAEHQIRGRS
jgi:hypothetical protein